MSNTKILDVDGNEYKEKLMPESREKIAKNIFLKTISGEDANQFLMAAAQFLMLQGKVPDANGHLSVSIEDEDMQNFSIQYGTEKVMDQALDENIAGAYLLLLRYANSIYEKNDDIDELDEKYVRDLEKYFAATPELQLAKQICDIQSEINLTMSGQQGKSLTSFQANRIQEKFEEISPYLNNEQCAAGYYRLSIIHRVLLGEKDIYNPEENNAEKECLKKVLTYTSDHNRIDYCVNRLGTSYPSQGLVRAAYRRALSQAGTLQDLYKINMALANCYVSDYRPQIGFNYDASGESNKYRKLERAEYYYSNAFEAAPVPERINVLKRLANVQFQQNKIEAWTRTKTIMAMEYMEGEERCHTLMDIAKRNKNLRIQYLERVVQEAVRAKGMGKDKRSDIILDAANMLHKIYEKNHDEDQIKKMEAVVQKYTYPPEILINPLLRYKSGKKIL